ncbi:MAG: hypothetical protein IPP71_06280 [Bacteroidetes bacterium]|nr:hypothetical protein [Bacteroidota bacterium]
MKRLFHFLYSSQNKELVIPASTIYLNSFPYEMSANFNLADSGKFSFKLGSNRIKLTDLVKMTTPVTAKKLSPFDLKYPVQFQLEMEGSLAYKSIPKINCRLIAERNTLRVKNFEFRACNLVADFSNHNDSNLIPSDENSKVTINKFKANWEGIPLNSESIVIRNLKKPLVSASVYSNFALKEVNRLAVADLFNFSRGTCSFIFQINALPDSLHLNAVVNGSILIKDGRSVYGPRSMPFDNINGKIIINDGDVEINDLSCNTGSSKLSLTGEAPGLINFLSNSKQEAKISWRIKSPFIDLKDFTPFLSKRKDIAGKKVQKTSVFFHEGSKLDLFLDASILDMEFNIAKVVFQNFTATELTGKVKLIKDEWKLKTIFFKHAEGDVKLNGILKEVNTNLLSVNVDAEMRKLNISQVLKSFDNFGQTALTSENIDGVLYADASFDFTMSSKIAVAQSSLSGKVDLTVINGNFKGFQPIGKLGKFLFPKRDFTDIKFSEIANSFILKGDELFIERMKVNTSVLEMYLEGSYFLNGKTDLDIQIPMANLKKRDWDELSKDIGDKGDKGMNVFIHAVTDDKGELKFKYDPLKKIKEKNNTGFKKFIDRLK